MACLTKVEFLDFPIITLQDQYGNVVGEHQQVTLNLEQCGEFSQINYVPHVWPDDDVLDAPPASPPYSFTDANGIVEFRNFTLIYQNENKAATCRLGFSSVDTITGTTAALAVDVEVTPPIYPDGAPQCPVSTHSILKENCWK